MRITTMKDFISEIRKIKTDNLIYAFSEISIDMFKNNEFAKDIELLITRYGKHKKMITKLSAWDIQNIVFLSVKNSNDYRQADKICSLERLVHLYRQYENEHSYLTSVKTTTDYNVFHLILGMTAEQFQFQRLGWIFERFNRDYYILLGATNFEHRHEIDTNKIVKEIFGYSANDYIVILLTVFWLCTKNPAPLTAPENLYCRKADTVIKRKNLIKFIEYYSCTYKELRSNSLGKQLLYSKPFIKTQKEKAYLSTSTFLVAMLVGNGLYWLIRNYYLEKGTQQFTNAFGLLFEDYIKDLAKRYCTTAEWSVLPSGSRKGADFVFDFGILQFIVESKSTLLRLDVKQQIPNLESANYFFEHTIKEAYEQLNSSYEQLRNEVTVPIIKIILLYDEFSNTAIIELASKDIFEKDNQCYVMTIRELEMLLYIHCNDKIKEQLILEKIVESIDSEKAQKNIGLFFDELSLQENPHLDGDMDYFLKLMQYFKINIE